MTTSTENALQRFISETRELFLRVSDVDKRWTALGKILAELLADRDVVAASKKWPDCKAVDRRAENLLFYEDPDYKFVINALVVNAAGPIVQPSHKSRIHDHGRVYTLYGLLDGHQGIRRFERLDDGSTKDYAEIREVDDSRCGPGEMHIVRPYEIHCEESLGERVVAVIIRSEQSSSTVQGRYEPESNGYWEGYGPRQTRISFF